MYKKTTHKHSAAMVFLLAAILFYALLFTGCGGQSSEPITTTVPKVTPATVDNSGSVVVQKQPQATEQSQPAESTPTPVKFAQPEDISFTTYDYETRWSRYNIIVLTNNSDYDCKLSVNMKYLDSEEKMIDISSDTVDALAAHTSVCLTASVDYDYATVAYDIKTSELSSWYKPCVQNLEVDYNMTASSVVGTVTNNGDYAAEFVHVTVLFFNGDQCVYQNWTYATDDDSEIKPGQSEAFKCEPYGTTFDSVQVYLEGRSSAK